MIKVAVIIPYFQRRPGILRRALTSVLQQEIPQGVEVDVIVADDGSPVSARGEIQGLEFIPPYRLITIEQQNAGPAAARNTALHQLQTDTTYVAFLDSDDIWDPKHLPTAIAALECGFDYYFCNNRRDESHENYFAMISFNPPTTPVITSPAIEDVHEVDKEVFFNRSLRRWVSLTPTIVYRRSVDVNMAFDTSLRVAAEDCFFFLQFIVKCKRICYSSKILVTCADGINIWQSRYGWDNPTHRSSQLSLVLSEQRMRRDLPLTEENKQYLDNIITIRRRFFAYLTIRWFLKKRDLWPTDMVMMARSDPSFWLWYPLNVLYIAIGYPLRFYAPMNE